VLRTKAVNTKRAPHLTTDRRPITANSMNIRKTYSRRKYQTGSGGRDDETGRYGRKRIPLAAVSILNRT